MSAFEIISYSIGTAIGVAIGNLIGPKIGAWWYNRQKRGGSK